MLYLIPLAILVVAFCFYYSYRSRQEVRRERQRELFERKMSDQVQELMDLKDVVADDPAGIQKTPEGVSFLELKLRPASDGQPRSVVMFGKKAEEIAPQIKRGTRIRARGRPKTREVIGDRGQPVEVFELIASSIELAVQRDDS
jgi:hypothetical protein